MVLQQIQMVNLLFLDISPGSYDVSVQMIGYTVKLFSGIELKENERKKIDVGLESTVLALGQEITVIGENLSLMRNRQAHQ